MQTTYTYDYENRLTKINLPAGITGRGNDKNRDSDH
jgi:hypothetical protein